jgi:hypothetical protein
MAQIRNPLGWLVYGVACGSLFGLFVGIYHFATDVIWEYSRAWAAIILAGAAMGLGAGLIVDAKLRRNPGVIDWLIFIVLVILLILFLPTLNSARE